MDGPEPILRVSVGHTELFVIHSGFPHHFTCFELERILSSSGMQKRSVLRRAKYIEFRIKILNSNLDLTKFKSMLLKLYQKELRNFNLDVSKWLMN